MAILLVIFFTYTIQILGKYFYFLHVEPTSIDSKKRFRYIYISFLPTLETRKIKTKEQKLLAVSEILSFWAGLIYVFGLTYLYSQNDFENLFSIGTHFLVFSLGLVALLYLAIYDIIFFAVPTAQIRSFLFFTLLANIIAGILFLVGDNFNSVNFSTLVHLGQFENVVGAAVLAGATLFLVKVTSEEGLGGGDVDVSLLIGLLLGWPLILPFILATLIIGSIIGTIYALVIEGRFKNVRVPFVPFILLGYVISIGLGDMILDILYIN